MNDEQLDRQLHQAGARWRGTQPPPPGVDSTSLAAARRPRWVAPVAAAAAVAAVVSGAALLARDGGDRDAAPGPADSSVPEDYVVPWKQLDPTHPTWPAPVDGYTPDPTRTEPVADLGVRQVSFSQESEHGPGTAIVALTANVDTPLAPCPDAQLSLRHSFDDFTEIAYGLNCAAVPFRLDDGTPYIPAGRALRFEVPVPDWGEVRPTYTWTLAGPVPVTIDLEPDVVEPRVVDDATEATFVLEVSNQSFDEPVMPIKVYVDEVLLVDNAFHVEGQHTWVSYPMLLSPGEHLIRVESADGASYQDKVGVEQGKVRYALLEYWNDGARDPQLTWRAQDQPFGHD